MSSSRKMRPRMASHTIGPIQPALAEVVDLNFFCGFSFVEIAAMNGSSEPTIRRQWEKARLYLHQQLSVVGVL